MTLREQASALLTANTDWFGIDEILHVLQPMFDQMERAYDDARSNATSWASQCDDLRAKLTQVEAIAREALDEWTDSAQYKGDFLSNKHGDLARIKELRAALDGRAALDRG